MLLTPRHSASILLSNEVSALSPSLLESLTMLLAVRDAVERAVPQRVAFEEVRTQYHPRPHPHS